jgi:hypothetical protein
MTAIARFCALLIGDVLCGVAGAALILAGVCAVFGAVYGIALLLVSVL